MPTWCKMPHTPRTRKFFYPREQMRAAGWHPKTTWSPATEHVRRACKAASRNTAGTRALCCTAGLGACSRGHSPHPTPTVTVTCISQEVVIEEDDNKRPTHPNPTRARLPPYFSNTTRPHVQQPIVCTLMPCRAPGYL
jgi:hypothetical protein